MSIYTQEGYNNRRHYLECLAQDMNVDEHIVFALADILGPSEDFDGLITSLEDHIAGY
jgi:hypothetical protein